MNILIFGLVILFGFNLAKFILRNSSFWENFGLSFTIGIGLITLGMFYYSWIGIKINEISVFFFLIIVNTLVYLLLRKFKIGGSKLNIKQSLKGFNLFGRIALIIVLIEILLSLVITLYYPVEAWDALALYDFRAKIITNTGFFVQIADQFYYFAHYPLLTSLAHTIVYLYKGINPQFIYSLYLIFFAISFYVLLRKHVGKNISLLSTLLVISTVEIFEHSTISYTNLPYTVYYVLGLLYLSDALVKNDRRLFIISTILIGLSTWTRATEPFWIIAVLAVIIFSLMKKQIKIILIYLLILLALQQPWRYFMTSLYGHLYSAEGQVGLTVKTLMMGINVNRLSEILNYVYENILISWGPVLLLFITIIIFETRKIFQYKYLIPLILILSNFLLVIFGTYIFSFSVPEWREIADSAKRMSIFFIPLMIYFSTIVISDKLGEIK